ncbi:MAG: hypothetical protein KatS3mg008_2215 [Acidimicrobiales bacterium]|nr:MAG: hypothetical protein KatS3mg008_2215 [Acidimicrobiales bacterium]
MSLLRGPAPSVWSTVAILSSLSFSTAFLSPEVRAGATEGAVLSSGVWSEESGASTLVEVSRFHFWTAGATNSPASASWQSQASAPSVSDSDERQSGSRERRADREVTDRGGREGSRVGVDDGTRSIPLPNSGSPPSGPKDRGGFMQLVVLLLTAGGVVLVCLLAWRESRAKRRQTSVTGTLGSTAAPDFTGDAGESVSSAGGSG